jgi:hypothetical protein
MAMHWQQRPNAVLENYKSHHGKVLRTNSLPGTPDRPAEHFIAVVFGRQNFIEVAFARFKLVDGIGCSIVYSHRIYGEKIGDQMSAWIDHNGAKIVRTLMEWNNMPFPASLGGYLVNNNQDCGRDGYREHFRSSCGYFAELL